MVVVTNSDTSIIPERRWSIENDDSPVTKDRTVTGFPDRSPETKIALEKLTRLCENGASIITYCLMTSLRPASWNHCATEKNSVYSCGVCDVCSKVSMCCDDEIPDELKYIGQQFNVSRVKGGITNLMLHLDHNEQEPLALRIYGLGSEHIIDRPRELMIVEYLSQFGIGKKVYSRFVNRLTCTQGQVEEWIAGDSLTPEQMREPKVSHKIAKKIAQLHILDVPSFLSRRNSTASSTTARPRKMPTLKRLSEHHINKTFDWLDKACGIIKADERFSDMRLLNLDLVIDYVEKIVELEEVLLNKKDVIHNDQERLVHGDLLSGNIVLDPQENIRFIDFEYTDVGSAPYDIANHFCEMTGFDCTEADYDKYYPDEVTQREFIKIYTDEVVKIKGLDISKEILEEEYKRLYNEIQLNVIISHFYWGSWALNKALWQSTEKQIEFDFKKYAFQRFSAGLSAAFKSRIPYKF